MKGTELSIANTGKVATTQGLEAETWKDRLHRACHARHF